LSDQDWSDEFLERLNAVTGRRARIVVDHILEHGFITTEDLETLYGYKHPPRAVRDVRDQGIPIETFTLQNSQGKPIAAYRFGNPAEIYRGTVGGRRVFPKHLKRELYEQQNHQCAVCLQLYEVRYLQIDHRIPYKIAGEPDDGNDPTEFMLLCGSCNRAKSWSCEHCANKQTNLCRTCYWGNPRRYDHIALQSIRRLDLVWSSDEIADYEQVKMLAAENQVTIADYNNILIKRDLQNKLL
jgi:hypothetical protein